jgi:hypothetical protein
MSKVRQQAHLAPFGQGIGFLIKRILPAGWLAAA